MVKYIIAKVRFFGTPYRLIRNTLKSVHANLQLCITNVTIKSSNRLDYLTLSAEGSSVCLNRLDVYQSCWRSSFCSTMAWMEQCSLMGHPQTPSQLLMDWSRGVYCLLSYYPLKSAISSEYMFPCAPHSKIIYRVSHKKTNANSALNLKPFENNYACSIQLYTK